LRAQSSGPLKEEKPSQVLVAHTCNPGYSGGRDQEDHGLKPVWANSLRKPISKHPSKNRAGGVDQGEGPEFKPQYCQKKRKKERKKEGNKKNRGEPKLPQ
jgi:hypothetical protein